MVNSLLIFVLNIVYKEAFLLNTTTYLPSSSLSRLHNIPVILNLYSLQYVLGKRLWTLNVSKN